MAEHPVIACWGSADSAGALQLAAALADTLGQPLVLAVAYRYDPVALSARPLPSEADARRAAAAAATARRVHELLAGVADVREEVVAAQDVATGLVDLARRLDACVLVLGRDAEGHVVADVIGRATCPVAVSPFDVAVPGPQPVKRIAIADDGSPPAALAQIAAKRLAAAAGTVPQTLTVPDGADPASALAAASEAHDVLVCGSRGRGRLLRAVLGGVSSELVRTAHCAVLVVGPDIGVAPDRPLGLGAFAASGASRSR